MPMYIILNNFRGQSQLIFAQNRYSWIKDTKARFKKEYGLGLGCKNTLVGTYLWWTITSKCKNQLSEGELTENGVGMAASKYIYCYPYWWENAPYFMWCCTLKKWMLHISVILATYERWSKVITSHSYLLVEAPYNVRVGSNHYSPLWFNVSCVGVASFDSTIHGLAWLVLSIFPNPRQNKMIR